MGYFFIWIIILRFLIFQREFLYSERKVQSEFFVSRAQSLSIYTGKEVTNVILLYFGLYGTINT